MCNNKTSGAGDFLPINTSSALVSMDPAAIAAAEQAKAKIQMAYFMAAQKPRDEMQARAQLLQACQRVGFAEKAEYSKPIGGSTITGPSVRFAEGALRAWRNTYISQQVIFEDDDRRRIQVTCTDLETNNSYTKEAVVEKSVERKKLTEDRILLSERLNSYGQRIYVVRPTEEEMRTKEAAAISKAVRNEGLRLIPADIVEECLITARATLRMDDAADPKGKLKKVCDYFMSLGVMPNEIEKFLGHSLDIISPAELQNLRGIYQAIRDGETSWVDVTVPDVKDVATAASDTMQKVAEMKANLVQEEKTDPPKPVVFNEKTGELLPDEPPAKKSVSKPRPYNDIKSRK